MGIPKEILGDYPIPCNPGRLKRIVLTKFYRKPMARNVSMLKRSFMPIGAVNATISVKILRRLKNISRELPVEVAETIVKQYLRELR